MPQDSQNFIPVPPDLNAWIRLMFQAFSSSFNCVSLATVDSFDAAAQTVNLTINYIRVFKNANPNLPNQAPDGQTSDVLLPYPVLIQCPVFILQGGGAYITFPIQKGDTGLVLFGDREISTWLQTGQVAAPQNQRTHDLSDGIYFGGIRNLLNVIQAYDSSKATFSFPGGIISIKDSTGERLSEAGMMTAWGGTTAPSGWLLCQGQSLKRSDYPSLFAAIGTNYGSADSSHFNLPDMQGQVAVGLKSGDPHFGALGNEFGEQTHTLTVAEMPAHTHGIAAVNDALAGGTANSAIPNNSVQSASTGGDGAHNNIQPSLTVNWIIKT